MHNCESDGATVGQCIAKTIVTVRKADPEAKGVFQNFIIFLLPQLMKILTRHL